MFFADTYADVFRFEDPPLHDPCAVAYVIAPHLFKVGVGVPGMPLVPGLPWVCGCVGRRGVSMLPWRGTSFGSNSLVG